MTALLPLSPLFSFFPFPHPFSFSFFSFLCFLLPHRSSFFLLSHPFYRLPPCAPPSPLLSACNPTTLSLPSPRPRPSACRLPRPLPTWPFINNLESPSEAEAPSHTVGMSTRILFYGVPRAYHDPEISFNIRDVYIFGYFTWCTYTLLFYFFCELVRETGGGGAKGQSGYHSIWGSEVLYHYHVPSNQRNYSDQRYKKVFHFLL